MRGMAKTKLREYAGTLKSLKDSSWSGLTKSHYFAAALALALGRALVTDSGGGTEDAAAATAATAAGGAGWGSGELSGDGQGVVSAPAVVGGGAIGVAARGEERKEVSGESMSWSKDPSGGTVVTIRSGEVAEARPSMVDWTALARVNGTISG